MAMSSNVKPPLIGLATVGVLLAIVAISIGFFRGSFTKTVPVTVVSERAGLVMNADAKVNVPFGRTLTSVAKLPPGSRRDSSDRFADKGLPWKRLVFLFLILYLGWRWYRGTLDRYLPEQIQSRTVLGEYAPDPDGDPPPEPAPAGAAAPAPAAAPAKK